MPRSIGGRAFSEGEDYRGNYCLGGKPVAHRRLFRGEYFDTLSREPGVAATLSSPRDALLDGGEAAYLKS
jgi:hypothetical protein